MLSSRYAESTAIFCNFDLCAAPPLRLTAPRERLLAPPPLCSAPLRAARSLARAARWVCHRFARASFLSVLCVLTEHWKIHTSVITGRRSPSFVTESIALVAPRRVAPRHGAVRRGAARCDATRYATLRRDATRRKRKRKRQHRPVNSLALTSRSNPGSRATMLPTTCLSPTFDLGRLGGPSITATTRGDGARKRRTESVVPPFTCHPFGYEALGTHDARRPLARTS